MYEHFILNRFLYAGIYLKLIAYFLDILRNEYFVSDERHSSLFLWQFAVILSEGLSVFRMSYRKQKRWWNAYILMYERADVEGTTDKQITKSMQDLTIGIYYRTH